MKFFCFIFSVYILLLSFVPCEEFAAKAEWRVDEISQRAQLQSHEPADETSEDCSPFCICSCCHFSTAYQFKTFSVTDKIIVEAIFSPENSYQNPYMQNYQNSIWQPPKFNSRA